MHSANIFCYREFQPTIFSQTIAESDSIMIFIDVSNESFLSYKVLVTSILLSQLRPFYSWIKSKPWWANKSQTLIKSWHDILMSCINLHEFIPSFWYWLLHSNYLFWYRKFKSTIFNRTIAGTDSIMLFIDRSNQRSLNNNCLVTSFSWPKKSHFRLRSGWIYVHSIYTVAQLILSIVVEENRESCFLYISLLQSDATVYTVITSWCEKT